MIFHFKMVSCRFTLAEQPTTFYERFKLFWFPLRPFRKPIENAIRAFMMYMSERIITRLAKQPTKKAQLLQREPISLSVSGSLYNHLISQAHREDYPGFQDVYISCRITRFEKSAHKKPSNFKESPYPQVFLVRSTPTSQAHREGYPGFQDVCVYNHHKARKKVHGNPSKFRLFKQTN